MKKFFTLIAVALLSVAAFADSYTITFNNGGESQAVINPDNAVTTYVTEASAEYISGFAKTDGSSATRVYLKSEWEGAKVGNQLSSGFSAGNLTINLSAKGTVKATAITVNGKGTLTIAGKEFACGAEAYADKKQDLDGSELSAITVTSAEVAYVKSITVEYEASSFDKELCHSPRYSEGKTFEYLLGPDMIDYKTKTKAGAVKPAIADKYQWIQYVNPTSTLDDGTAEVQAANRGTMWRIDKLGCPNETTADYSTWQSVKGEDGYANKPALSAQWGKYIQFYVKDTKRFIVLATSSASCTADNGNYINVVATSTDGDIIEHNSVAGGLYGKGTTSDTVDIALDPAKSWLITVKGAPTVNKDIVVQGIQLVGNSEVAGPAVKKANPSFTYTDVIVGPDMLATKTKDGANKYGISDEYKWIQYVNPTSTLDDGTAEVQQSNRWTDLNPRTGEKGTWLQVKGQNGSVNSPVLSPSWGKYMKFYVQGTNKFTVYGTGSAGGTAADNNCLKVKVTPYNSNKVVETTSTPGGIYGKGTASDLVSIELNEAEKYEIVVEAAVKDIMLTGINLGNAAGDAAKAENKGTLNMLLDKAAADAEIDLGGETWTLNGIAATDQKALTIKNGSIKADEAGQITLKKSIVLDGVNIESTLAPIAMAAKETLNAADTTALYSWTVEQVPAVLYTEEEAETLNAASGAQPGEPEYIKAGDVKTPATTKDVAAKYENASNKVFEAQLISIKNSEIKTASSFVSGGNAPWALRKLEVDNSIIETSANSGKAFLNWEEGASQIKDIVIKNSTLYADSVNTTQRFHRYSAQVDPWRVWGYPTDGNKNEPGLNTWTLENNTIVNLCGNKEFSNNIKNTSATTFVFKGNVFANTWRIQKLGSNVTRNFEAADNAICGGVNAVDATDASKWATEDKEMGIYVNKEGKNFILDAYCATAEKKYGDPRYLSLIPEKTEISRMLPGVDTLKLKADVKYTLNAPANALADKVVTIEGNGASIKVGAEGQLVAKTGLIIDNVKMDASEAALAPIALAPKAALTAADTTALYTWTVEDVPAVLYTEEEAEAANAASGAQPGEAEYVKAGDVKTAAYVKDVAAKYENASNKCFEAQIIAIRNSEIKTATSFVTGGNAPWALRKLEVDNSIIETSANSGKAFLNWEEGATQIKDIVIKNSTLYADSVNTTQRFHRYSAQVDPWRVWGYETGTDKNAAGQNTWTLENNTIVNLCGNKEFSNNIKNTSATTFVFKGNVFANTWRIQKLGSNVTRNFEYTENAICGGVNAVDATDASKWAKEDKDMGVSVNGPEAQFATAAGSYAYYSLMGDPRWITDVQKDAAAALKDSLMKYIEDGVTLLDTDKDSLNTAHGQLQTAVTDGTSTYDNPDATTAQIYDAIKALQDAIAAFKAAQTGIATVVVDEKVGDNRAYNLAGQRVNANSRGIVIINGKKYMNR